jgi:hypothetical protein
MQPETYKTYKYIIYFSLESKKQMASLHKPMAERDSGKSVSQILRRRREVVKIIATKYRKKERKIMILLLQHSLIQ